MFVQYYTEMYVVTPDTKHFAVDEGRTHKFDMLFAYLQLADAEAVFNG